MIVNEMTCSKPARAISFHYEMHLILMIALHKLEGFELNLLKYHYDDCIQFLYFVCTLPNGRILIFFY